MATLKNILKTVKNPEKGKRKTWWQGLDKLRYWESSHSECQTSVSLWKCF